MLQRTRRVVLCATLFFFGVASLHAQTNRPDVTSQFAALNELTVEAKEVSSVARDLSQLGVAIGQNRRPDLDLVYSIASLEDLCTATSTYLRWVLTTFAMYTLIGDQDRTQANALLQIAIDTQIQTLDGDIKAINNTVPGIRSPGVATSATQLKEHLRRIQQILQSARPR